MDLVCATQTAHVTTSTGQSVIVREGGFWRVNDPIVRDYPHLFSEDVRPYVSTSEPLPVDAPVEQATAAPGEKRATVRKDT